MPAATDRLEKLAAEEAAMRLGFGDPWAHPVTSEQAEQAQWLYKRRPRHRQELAHKHSRGVHVPVRASSRFPRASLAAQWVRKRNRM
jgi:hypothetical protein